MALADFADQVGEVVLQLADIADVSPRAGGAVTADIHREGLHASCGQRRGQRMDGAPAGACGTMYHHGNAVGCRRLRLVMAIGELGAVTRLEAFDARQVAEVDGLARLRD